MCIRGVGGGGSCYNNSNGSFYSARPTKKASTTRSREKSCNSPFLNGTFPPSSVRVFFCRRSAIIIAPCVIASCFLSASETSRDVLLQFRLFMQTLEKQSWRKWTFLIGWTPLLDSSLKELHGQHAVFGRKKVNLLTVSASSGTSSVLPHATSSLQTSLAGKRLIS